MFDCYFIINMIINYKIIVKAVVDYKREKNNFNSNFFGQLDLIDYKI